MNYYNSTCDFILRETNSTKTKKRGKKKEEKPLFIYLQVRTSWNDKQIFKSTGQNFAVLMEHKKTAPFIWRVWRAHGGLYGIKRHSTTPTSCQRAMRGYNKAPKPKQTNKGRSKRLTSNACKTSTRTRTKTTYHQWNYITIPPHRRGRGGANTTSKVYSIRANKYRRQHVLKIFAALTSKKKPNSGKLNFNTQSPEQLEQAFIKYGVTSQRLEKFTKADIKRLEEEIKRTLLKRTANKYLSSFASAYYQITDKRLTFKKEKVQSDEDTIKKPTLSLAELQSVTADWLKLPLPRTTKRMHACTGLFLMQCWTACRVGDVAKVMDAIKLNYNQIAEDIKETGTGQISYTTRKTNETCFVPIFAQTLQVFDRLSKDKNLPLLLERLRVEDKITDYIKQHQQRRKTIEDIIKVMPAESMQNIINKYRKTGNAAKLLKQARDFDYFQRTGYNTHIKNYFQDLVKRGVLEDEIISCWTGSGKDSGKSAMIWKECSKWQNISSHCARHTFASIAFAEFGYTPQQVQSVTGHKDIAIIFKHYIERQAQDKRKSIESKAAAALALERLQQAI